MEDDEQEYKSRSQIKREFQELKDLVREMIELPDWHLDRLPLTERNRIEIVEARDLNRSALQRQLRYLVRRIEASEDVDALRSAVAEPPELEKDDAQGAIEEADAIEEQAAALVAGDNDVLGEFIDAHPRFNHRTLRRFVRAARKEHERGSDGPGQAAKQLADFLRS
jgi:ribosome-associated protein